ncbi:MAG: hypothetical protein KAV87_35630 [Desulfobacteraceae bacterium]|nr:hypothetical protein [Desulfobacteraceae bacterium]
MKDERIQATVKSIAAGGFFIYFVATLIALNYRLWILKQNPRQCWDFFAIFIIVSLYGFIAFASKGAFDQRFKKTWLTIGITVIAGNTVLFFIMGQINSIAELCKFLLGVIPSVGLVIAVAYFLNRHWKRKEGIEDEK